MHPRVTTSVCFFLLLACSSRARQQTTQPAPVKVKSIGGGTNASYFEVGIDLGLVNLLPSPPEQGSKEAAADLAEVHHIEGSRTADQIRAAQYDDTHEDIFIFAKVVEQARIASSTVPFSASALPITSALSAHLRKDAGLMDNPLKSHFHRLRPYNFDRTLHPVCATNEEFSYPSGHAINGYLYAYTLVQILPELHDVILSRAHEYAYHRVICGVHYATDVEASRSAALVLFGYLLTSPGFRSDLEASRRETRRHLNLP